MRVRFVGQEHVTIAPIARDATPRRAVSREPYARPERAAHVRLACQLEEVSENDRRNTYAGAQLKVRAEITLRAADVARSGYSPSSGDRVIRVEGRDGARDVSWYVTEVKRSGKLIRGGRQLVVLQLTDSAPTRVQSEGI